MTKINEVIPPMPEAPDSTTDTKTEFNVKADTFVKAWTPHTISINTWATEANAVATEINNVVASLPSGTIDDVKLSLTSAFSNQYVHDTYLLKTQYVITPELQAHLDAGRPMPDWDGAQWDNYLKIYPDGVVKGTDVNGGLTTRYPDGTQTFKRTGTFVGGVLNLATSYPFIDTDFAISGTINTGASAGAIANNGSTVSIMRLNGVYIDSTNNSIYPASQVCTVLVTGRWK